MPDLKSFRLTALLSLMALVLMPANGWARSAGTPVFSIPRLDNITIDGNPSDWADQGFRVEALASPNGEFRAPSQLDGRFRLGWNDRGLLVLVNVRDDSAIEDDDLARLWQRDCVEVYLADKCGGKNTVQAVIAAGIDPRFPELRYNIYDYRKDESLLKIKPTISAARTKTNGGCVMEVLMPWDNLGLKPQLGMEAGFQLFVDDYSPTAGVVNLLWYPAAGAHADSTKTHRIRLSEKPSPPVLAAGRAYYDGMRCTRAVVVASPELAGKPVSARVEGKEMTGGVLVERDGRAVASLKAPIPAPGTEWKSVELLMDGKIIDTVTLPDLALLRAAAMPRLKFAFHPFCFSGNRLPDGDFEDPAQAENVFGPYTLGFNYYDADFNKVATAEKPGRYEAIVEIRPEKGAPIKRFYPLYRFVDDVDWNRATMRVKTEFPKEFGVSRVAVEEQTESIGEFVKRQMRDGFDRTPDSAMLFGWLNEVAPGTPATDRTSPQAASDRWMYDLKKHTGDVVPLKYHIRMPDGAGKEPGKKLPLIIFLHGSGGMVLDDATGPQRPIETYSSAHKDFPFIVVSPQCPSGTSWNSRIPELDDLLAEIVAKYPVDADRVYLTGLSMGGFGSWRWSCERPDHFAAIVPICGGGDTRDVDRIKDIPIWVFHGGKDPTVPVQFSYDMVNALKKLNGRVRLTIFPEAGHDSWDQAYSTDELYSWMLEQQLGRPKQAQAGGE